MATEDKREVRVRVFVNQTWFDVDDAGNRSRVRDEEGMSDERREHRPAPEGRSARDTGDGAAGPSGAVRFSD